jgi:hypothetical protein
VRQDENLLEPKFHGKWVATAMEKEKVEDEGYFFGYPTAARSNLRPVYREPT